MDVSARAGARPPLAPRLLRWFGAQARDLPWRRSRTPYSVAVSELMLQQTTVAAVAPRFERFMARFPDWNALAAARPAAVLAEWAGLGYYRRARNLHALAREVVARGGEFPRDLDEALALPGVGAYTAGAILSLAHGIALPAVDGNVIRVIARHDGRPFRPGSAADRRAIEAIVMRHLPARRPGDFNEALMELGATTCTPRAPACPACPLARTCVARQAGRQEDFPARAKRPPMRRVSAAAAVILRRNRILLRRRPANSALMPGLWELPGGTCDGTPAAAYVAAQVLPALGGGVVLGEMGRVRHVVTHRSITLSLVRCRLERPPRSVGDLRWSTPEAATSLGLTAATTRALRLLAGVSPRT